jgi:lipopolysaccharide export system protein LptA
MSRLLRASLCLLATGASARSFAGEAPAAPARAVPATPAAPTVPTVIESGAAEMVSTEKETTFTFSKGVTVTGTNIKLTCEFLEVVALRSGDPNATIGKQENFKSLIATGNVRIVQNDREAICERAEVFPGEDKVVLTGNPRVRSLDGDYEASGPRMELLRGERRARIIQEDGQRPRITLPPLKDLGYEKEKPKTPPNAESSAEPPRTESAPPPLTVPLPK